MSTTGINPTEKHSMKCSKLSGGLCRCDGYYTFEELYAHRFALWQVLLNCQMKIAEKWGEEGHEVWKSKLHSDGTNFIGWFISGLKIEKGKQMTYHLPLSEWENTPGKILEKVPEYDGHTSDDVLERLKEL